VLDRSLIAGLPAFAGMSDQDLDLILQGARSSRHPKNAAIFSQDQDARAFYLLLSGHIRVVRTTPSGEQLIARYINEGELFGIAVAMGRATYPAAAIAAVDCIVLTWPNSEWPKLQAAIPGFAAMAYETIGSRLQETQERVVEMATEQVDQRVAQALLRLVERSGRKTEAGVEIDFPITRQNIAEMTGTTLHTVSRLLSAWEGEGLVSGGRQKVTVTDPRRLMVVATNRHQKSD
jgi:CRP-like cAMP-binding protein